MTCSYRFSVVSPLVLGAASLALAVSAPPARAQEVDVQASIDCFVTKLTDRLQRPEQRTNPPCPPGVLAAPAYLRPGRYDAAVVVSVLDGLEQLAMTASNRSVRISAVSSIASAGREHTYLKSESQIVPVPWLLRLYQTAASPDVKLAALDGLGRQQDRRAAAEALGMIANDQPARRTDFHRSYPAMAVIHLRFMGPEGEVVLRRLLTEDRVHPGIRSEVEAALRPENLILREQ